jgi:diguanylate cyclase (GGDEF)-like protein
MSFRGRLRLFFGLIVIVPMIALTLVLFTLTARSETGKADAGISAGARIAFGVHRELAEAAAPALREVTRDRALRSALAAGNRRAARARLRQLAGAEITAIELYSLEGDLIERGGSPAAVAARGAEIAADGQTLGTITVSVTRAEELARRLNDLTDLEVAVLRGRRSLASTVRSGRFAEPGAELGEPRDFELAGEEYRGRLERIAEPAGEPLRVVLLRPRAAISEQIADNRLVIGVLLATFLLLALVSATIVSRALTGQIRTFLAAAHRLARGDFRQPVPVEGRDEFAELGREFNSMSRQLESKIEEVERKREELAETIRRVGDALATGLDRDGVVALAVRQAVDACEADAGRALSLDRGAFRGHDVGALVGDLETALEMAERAAFAVKPEVGSELLEALDHDSGPVQRRRVVRARAGRAHGLAVALRSLVGGPEYLGAISIARRDVEFSRAEEELLEYLAGQAVVSIENASLHQTVERQAVTDELTGLANLRALGSILNREIERSRRFESPLAFVMLDIDDFKQVNDTHGHQQGDKVLAHVASVLRALSRDVDAPARYGGEELAVVVPGTDVEGAVQLAERMREAIERMQLPGVGGGGSLRVTASFGVAAIPESALDGASLIAAADAALYRAKRAGKNRVARAGPLAARSAAS